MDEQNLKVRRGSQVFGPFALTDLAELLAAGRFGEDDLLSENGGAWTKIADYVAGHADPAPAATSSADDADDFVCIPHPPPTWRVEVEPRAPAAKTSSSGPDSDYLLETPTDQQDVDDDLPLSESRDPGAERPKRERSFDRSESYQVPRVKPKRPKPPPLPFEVDELPPRRRKRAAKRDEDDFDAPADESQLDDVLNALAEDEQEAPTLKRTPPKKRPVSPSGQKPVRRKRKRR